MKEMFEMFEKSTQFALETARKMNELNLRSLDKVMQQQSELAGIYMDVSAKGLELAGKAKGFQDLISGQASLMRECGERYMETARKAMSQANESRGEYGALVEENMKSAQEHIARVSSATFKVA